jgi:hypothetical protein
VEYCLKRNRVGLPGFAVGNRMSSSIDSCEAVQDFFLGEVRDAMSDLRVETAAATEKYLVDLLTSFSVSARIQTLFEPLVTQLAKARNASGPERANRMRELGDVSLFVCGFFPDSFERRGLDRGYVVAMGGHAYLVVGEATRRLGDASDGHVFVELAERFHELARVLDEVRERTSLCTDAAVLRLYERFRESGSPTLLRRLHRRGVHPARDKADPSLH